MVSLSYLTFIQNFSNGAPKSVTHHYKRSFSGFAAKLTREEADKMAGV